MVWDKGGEPFLFHVWLNWIGYIYIYKYFIFIFKLKHDEDELVTCMSDVSPHLWDWLNWNRVKNNQANGAEKKKVFTFVFIFLTEVNTVCKIQINVLSSFFFFFFYYFQFELQFSNRSYCS